jgi:hypothetical protein
LSDYRRAGNPLPATILHVDTGLWALSYVADIPPIISGLFTSSGRLEHPLLFGVATVASFS